MSQNAKVKFKVLVEAIIEIEECYVDNATFGINKIAEDYAQMATKYFSIGADSSRVIEITKVEQE